MAQVPVFVVVKGDEDIKRLTGAVEQMAAKTAAANAQSSKMSGILSGVAQGVGIAGVMSVANAAATLRDVLQSSVEAAMEDQRSVAALGVALRDNIPAWNGNTAALERQIAARTRFGFADDVLRSSISTLVTVTHDQTRALELQSIAMNIARARGIELSAASDMVAKAEAGSATALMKAVPAARQAASAQEALRVAAEATAGQFEAYANTTAGKVAASQVAMGEASEKLGYALMPIVSDAATSAASAVTTLSDGMAYLGSVIPGVSDDANLFGAVLNALSSGSFDLAQRLRDAAAAAEDQAAAQDYDRVMIGFASRATQDAIPAITSYTGWLHEAADAARDEAAATLTAAQAAALLQWQMGHTVNAQTGFTLSTNDVAAAGQRARISQLDWIISQQRLTSSIGGSGGGGGGGTTKAVRDLTDATNGLTKAEDAIIDRLLKEGGYVTALGAAYDRMAAQRRAAEKGTKGEAGDKGVSGTFDGTTPAATGPKGGTKIPTNDAATATQAQGATTAPTGIYPYATSGGSTPAAPPVVNNYTATINLGAFLGTEGDAKKFAAAMWQAFDDETTRRAKVQPPAADWKKVKEHAGV